MSSLLNFGPYRIFGMGESRHSKFGEPIDINDYWRMHHRLPRRGCVQGRVTSLILGKITVQETVHDRDTDAVE